MILTLTAERAVGESYYLADHVAAERRATRDARLASATQATFVEGGRRVACWEQHRLRQLAGGGRS